MTDKTFAAVADAFRAWQDSRSPDLAQAEARIDCLLATLFEQSRENAALAGDLVYFRSVAGTMLQTIDRLQREIARKDAEIARMRTDPARRPTRAERLVDGLQARSTAAYAFESMEEQHDHDRPS